MKIAVLTFPRDNEKNQNNENLHFFPFEELELVFLSGYSDTANLQPNFRQNGLNYQVLSHPALEKAQMMVACRSQFIVAKEDQASAQPEIGLQIYLPESAITIAGIQFPRSQDMQTQNSFFQKLIQTLQTSRTNRTILIGDFRIQSPDFNMILEFKHYFQEIASLGWLDAWRGLHPMTYEQIWYGHLQQEIRFNLVFLSPRLRESLVNAYHCFCLTNHKNARAVRALIVELV